MIPVKQALNSTIGRKYLMAVSGLALVGFIVVHLAGNLTLYLPDGDAFNTYAAGLHNLGPLLWIAEIVLASIFLLHIVLAWTINTKNWHARGGGPGKRYGTKQTSKGGPSYLSIFSNNMLITGSVLGLFLVGHILHFKYGIFHPEEVREAVVLLDGQPALDLHQRVAYSFANPIIVAIYVAVMLFLGAHLRHGFWSAFQSLGALNWRLEKPMTWLAVVVAIVLAAGFIGIPIYMFLMIHLVAG